MASLQKFKSGTEHQVKLLIELKEKVDLVYKQLNQYRGACRSVDRLNRAVRRTGGQLYPDRMLAEFDKFERDYRVSRKRIRKLDRQLLAFNLYDKLYDLYESLVMGESIRAGGDLIDSSAIVVGCNGPMGIEDTSVDDIAGISIDHDTPIDVEMDLMEDAWLEPRQSATLNHSLNKSSADVSACIRVTRQQTRRRMLTFGSVSRQMKKNEANIDLSAIVVGCNGPVETEDNIGSTERPFQCPQCDKSFKRTFHLSIHKRIHESEPRFKCSWEGCDYGTYYSQSLKAHQTVHTGERPFHCPQCDKSFRTSASLSKHKWTHESKLRFKCKWEGCDYGTNFNENLNAHQAVHTRKHRFKCSWEGCGFVTYYSQSLKDHQTVHTGERSFQCSQCDKSFKTPSTLRNHKLTHESKLRFKCSWEGCDYGTNHHRCLKNHQTVHCDERPIQCSQCDKSFRTTSSLSKHKKIHESNPRFKCSWVGCDYSTIRLEHFKSHETVHSDERPFQCPQCDKSFKTSNVLKNHKRIHESEPRFKCS